MAKLTTAAKIRAFFLQSPEATPSDAAAALKISKAYVAQIRWMDKRNKRKPNMAERAVAKVAVVAPVVTAAPDPAPKADMVNHPPHYTVGGIETIDFIEAKALPYNLGNVVKYITRADLKGNRLQDLEKARWYLNREIQRVSDARA